MNIRIRLLVALALFAAIVIAGIGAPAWADKLNIGVKAPADNVPQAGLAVGSRPQGTVPITPPTVTLTSDQVTTVGSCSTVVVKSALAGVEYTASVVPADALPVVQPGNLISCAIKVEAKPGTTLGAAVQVCFPMPPTIAGFAQAHDGTKWAKSTLEVKDGQACVDLQAGAASPSFAGLFDK